MPLQNRVSPFSELVAVPARGLVYGNRGCLHDESGRIRRRSNGKRWIACRLSFKDWRRSPLMQPGRFTELFFLDEVTAFAAGHRPCALCRREDYVRFVEIWGRLHPDDSGAAGASGAPGAEAIDLRLHAERVDAKTRAQRHHEEPFDSLPDGAMVLEGGQALLVVGQALLQWTPAGYVEPCPRPLGRPASVITPPSLVEVLRCDWKPVVPLLHPSALSLVQQA
ncbi:MAG: hypothetical protein WD186_02465 [Actinomycetota bacterium]